MTTLDEWADELREAADRITPEAKKVVSRGAVQIKLDWRKRWTGYPHIKHIPRLIAYDLYEERNRIVAEIGPAKLGQGELSHLIEYGSPTSAPIPGGAPALATETPKFERALADLGENLLSGRPL